MYWCLLFWVCSIWKSDNYRNWVQIDFMGLIVLLKQHITDKHCLHFYHRCCCHRVTEQEVLSDGLLHSSKEQHEGDQVLLCTHLPPVPLLRSPSPAAARMYRHSGCAATAARPPSATPQQTGLGSQSEQWHHRGKPRRTRALLAFARPSLGWTVVFWERLRGLYIWPWSMSEEEVPLDMNTHFRSYLFLVVVTVLQHLRIRLLQVT